MGYRRILPLLGLLLFICWPQSAHAVIAATTNTCTATEATSTSNSCTLNTTTLTSGSIIICVDEHGANLTTSTLSDPTNGTYAADATFSGSGVRTFFSHKNTSTAASLLISIAYGGTSDKNAFACQEFTGQAATTPFDTSASGGPSASNITSGTFTTSQANEVILANCSTANAGNTLSFSGYTQISQITVTIGFVYSYLVVSSIQTNATVTCTNTGGINSSMLIATYKASVPAIPASVIAGPTKIAGPAKVD